MNKNKEIKCTENIRSMSGLCLKVCDNRVLKERRKQWDRGWHEVAFRWMGTGRRILGLHICLIACIHRGRERILLLGIQLAPLCWTPLKWSVCYKSVASPLRHQLCHTVFLLVFLLGIRYESGSLEVLQRKVSGRKDFELRAGGSGWLMKASLRT